MAHLLAIGFSSHIPLLLVIFVSIVLRKTCYGLRNGSDCGHDCQKDFIYCTNGYNSTALRGQGCECSASHPIVVDNRFCLGHRQYNETCFLSQQCRHNDRHSNIGCFLDGHSLEKSHNAVKQIVDTISWQSVDTSARCLCADNHYYDSERRMCLCERQGLRDSGQRCATSGPNAMSGHSSATPLHFAETIVFWIVLMLILTLVFMLLTIFRKCYFNTSGYVDYRTTNTTTTVVDMRFINNLIDSRPRSDRPPTYEEAIHGS